MAVIEHIAVKNTPLALLKYITGETKDEKAAFITGLNCSEDAASAYMEMGLCYESYANEKFSARTKGGGKQKIKLHHYIQSFKADEITPERAHDIAVQWARAVFGTERQILIATHTDTEHIHTHFAVNAYDMDGVHWIDNKKTLQHCRDVSDRMLKARGLSVIENPQTTHDHTYTEWLARKSGTSWKALLCDVIDRIVLKDNVKDINNLVSELRKSGYLVKRGKYLSVKPAELTKSKYVRTYRLGDGYGIEELQYRIENKDKEMSLAAIERYEGIQKEYAICLRELQIMIYRKPDKIHRATYRELVKNTELLCYLSDRNIHSVAGFENTVNAAAEKADSLKKRRSDLQQEIERLEEHAEDISEHLAVGIIGVSYTEKNLEHTKNKIAERKETLSKIETELETAETEKAEAAGHYKTYLQQIQNDYTYLFERLKREQEEQEERAREQAERERQREIERKRSETPTRTYRSGGR